MCRKALAILVRQALNSSQQCLCNVFLVSSHEMAAIGVLLDGESRGVVLWLPREALHTVARFLRDEGSALYLQLDGQVLVF